MIQEILRRNKACLPLNARNIVRDANNRDTMLYQFGRTSFGSRQAAIEAARLNYDQISRKRKIRISYVYLVNMNSYHEDIQIYHKK